MPDLVVWIQTVAMVTAALAALGAFRYIRLVFQLVQEHERTLHGHESVSGWNGIVPMVEANRQRIRELERGDNDRP